MDATVRVALVQTTVAVPEATMIGTAVEEIIGEMCYRRPYRRSCTLRWVPCCSLLLSRG